MEVCYILRNLNKRSGIARSVCELVERAAVDREIERVHWIGCDAEEWAGMPPAVVQHRTSLPDGPFHKMLSANVRVNTKMAEKLCFSNPDMLIQSEGCESGMQHILRSQSCHQAAVDAAKKMNGPLYSLMRRFDPITKAILKIEKDNYMNHRFNKVVAVSNRAKNELHEYYGVPELDMEVVPHAVNLTEFNPGNKALYWEPARKELRINKDDEAILFAGYEFKRKGLSLLLDAIAFMETRPKVIIVGGKNEREIASFKALAERKGIGDKTRFVGRTTQMTKYMAAADVFVFPTLYDPFGLVVLESAAAGLPVVTTKECGASELFTDLKEGVVIQKVGDRGELASAIRIALDSREKMGTEARKTAEKYSWDWNYQKMKEVYKKVMT